MKRLIIIIFEVFLLVVLFTLRYFYGDEPAFNSDYTGFRAILGYLFFLLCLDSIRRLALIYYSKKNKVPVGYQNNFHFGINNISKLLVGIGFVVTIFGVFGVDIRTLLTTMSIVAAALAIITKEYINDFLIGIYFSFSKDFEIGDFVKIGDHKGKIIGIKMLKIKLLNDDDDAVLIPNSKIYNNEIINYTKRDIRLMSIDFQIDIQQVDELEKLESELIDSLIDFNEYIEPNSYNLKIVEMKMDYIDFKFQYTLRKTDREIQRQIRKNTVRQVFNHITTKKLIDKSEGNMESTN